MTASAPCGQKPSAGCFDAPPCHLERSAAESKDLFLVDLAFFRPGRSFDSACGLAQDDSFWVPCGRSSSAWCIDARAATRAAPTARTGPGCESAGCRGRQPLRQGRSVGASCLPLRGSWVCRGASPASAVRSGVYARSAEHCSAKTERSGGRFVKRPYGKEGTSVRDGSTPSKQSLERRTPPAAPSVARRRPA